MFTKAIFDRKKTHTLFNLVRIYLKGIIQINTLVDLILWGHFFIY